MSGLLMKRSREDEPPHDSPKRFHGETERQILHLLEDIESVDKNHEDGKCGPSEEVINGVMRSLEEEIRLTSSSTSSEGAFGLKRDDSMSSDVTSRYETQDPDFGGIDLSYLLGASDDELGIPPSPLQNLEDHAISSSPKEEGFGISLNFAANAELKGSVEKWHFEDDLADNGRLAGFEDPAAWDVVNPGAFIEGDYSVPWSVETAGGLY